MTTSPLLATIFIFPTLLLADGLADLSNLRDSTKNTANNISALANDTANGGAQGISVSSLTSHIVFTMGFNLGWTWVEQKVESVFD